MISNLFFLITATVLLITSCQELSSKNDPSATEINTKSQIALPDTLIVYKSNKLVIQKLADHIYQHISFLSTQDFGRVDCNGMIVINKNQAVVFDTPSDDEGSKELIDYIVKELQCEIKAIIPTHFHGDCVGGLEAFNERGIPAIASFKTIELLKQNGRKFSKPIQGFSDSLVLNVGDQPLHAQYFGEGHTSDNIIGYFPAGNAVFGGCLLKALDASKGNLEDANIKEWPETVMKIKDRYPQAAIVIPGHGKTGNAKLFDYTIELFK